MKLEIPVALSSRSSAAFACMLLADLLRGGGGGVGVGCGGGGGEVLVEGGVWGGV